MRKKRGQKNYGRNNNNKHHIFVERHEHTHPRNAVNSSMKNSKTSTIKHIIVNETHHSQTVKMQVKERILKQLIKVSLIRLVADFSSEAIRIRRQWDDICKMLEKKKSTKNSIHSKIILQNERN